MAKCITTYNGSENNGNTLVTLLNFFIAKGLSGEQASCIIGYLENTSSLKPDTEVKDNNKTYIGICKWEGDRAAKLKEYATQSKKEWNNMDLQLDFLWSELNGTYKKNIVDWFTAHGQSSIKECTKQWIKEFTGCNGNNCGESQINSNAEKILEFYKKYANGECTLTEQSNTNGSTTDGSGISNGLQVDVSQPSKTCGVQVSTTTSGYVGDATTSNPDGTVSSITNTTDYTGKTLTLRMEREIFVNCDRTISKLYDTTDGKKEFICFTVEDRVRYKPDGKCCKYRNNSLSTEGQKGMTAIPYGTYGVTTSVHAKANPVTSECGNDPAPTSSTCHYFYAATYDKFPEYNRHVPRLESINKDGCIFSGVLIHASVDPNRGNEDSSSGCIVVGQQNQNNAYLTNTHAAFKHLMENYILPAKKAGASIKIEIPRLHPDKDTKCWNSGGNNGRCFSKQYE